MNKCSCSQRLSDIEDTCVDGIRNILEDHHVPGKNRYINALIEDSANNRFYLYDGCGRFVELASGTGGGSVQSVNDKSGTVILSTDDIEDTLSIHKYTTVAEKNKLAGIQAGAQVNAVSSVNGAYGVVVLHSDSFEDTDRNHRFVTAADLVKLDALYGTNTGDQDLTDLVPNTITVNAQPLSENVVLTQDDIADGTTNVQFSSTEKTKLSNIETAATANDTDANLKDRANHTGTQLAATISDLNTAGWVIPPATATSPGTAGQRAYESGYLYVCVNTNTWERVALATW